MLWHLIHCHRQNVQNQNVFEVPQVTGSWPCTLGIKTPMNTKTVHSTNEMEQHKRSFMLQQNTVVLREKIS